ARNLCVQPVAGFGTRSGYSGFEVVTTKSDDSRRSFLCRSRVVARCSQVRLTAQRRHPFAAAGDDQKPVLDRNEVRGVAAFDFGRVGGWTNPAKQLAGRECVRQFVALEFAESR